LINWQPENGKEKINLYETNLPGSRVKVYLVENKKYLSSGPIYFEKTAFVGSKKEIDRFMFFSKAIYELLKHPKFFKPDIIHCNDWHTGFLVKLLKDKSYKTIFTIHNLANQGKWKRNNLMAEGIKNANKVTTVSPNYAKEILTKEYGEGLETVLRQRKKDLIGILNGIDYDEWK
jgi:starch synthase